MNEQTKESNLIKTGRIIAVLGILWHFYVLGFRATAPGILRPVHILFIVLIAYFLVPKPGTGNVKKLWWIIDTLLTAAIIASTIYIIMDQRAWMFRSGMLASKTDVIFSILTTLLVLVLTQRTLGWPLVILSILTIIYAGFGNYAPGLFKIFPYGISKIAAQMYTVENGLFSLLAGVSATYVLPFMYLGKVMEICGTGEYFMDLANFFTGKSRGGAGKVAVISSGLFGTISGAGAANVVATGTFTIPMMKKCGYKGYFAAAVEAVASSGGQIMPPIMASAAFLAAELSGIPYGTLALAAVIPAILYYLGLYVSLDLEAGRLDLKPISEEDIPDKRMLLRNCYLLAPLISIVIVLMVLNASPLKAAIIAIIVGIATAVVNPKTRCGVLQLTAKLFDGMYHTARDFVPIGLAFACASIVVGMLNLTGLGVKFSSMILGMAANQLLFALILTMIITIILGMGLPVAASYVIAASVAVPALVKMGVLPIAAQLFILHFASLSAITPPVALCAYAAAGISGDNPMKVGFTACRIGLVAFFVPFFFVYGPSLLIVVEGVWPAIWSGATAIIGTVAIAMSAAGWYRKPIRWINRLLLLAGGLLMVDPGLKTDIIGVLILVLGMGLHYFKEVR